MFRLESSVVHSKAPPHDDDVSLMRFCVFPFVPSLAKITPPKTPPRDVPAPHLLLTTSSPYQALIGPSP